MENNIYVTVPITYKPKQLTWDMVLKNIDVINKPNSYDTRTWCRTNSGGYYDVKLINRIIRELECFCSNTLELQKENMQELYSSYYIPKHSGGYRRIDNPHDCLKNAQYNLKEIFERNGLNRYHTCAFAYIPKRSIVMCRKKHADNKSKWYLYTDFSNFFGSISYEYALSALQKIYPFNYIFDVPRGQKALQTALKLCFLNGGLPQGSVMSPMLTNLLMIPIDYKINKLVITKMDSGKYTRYADDICISSQNHFDNRRLMNCIEDILKSENAPFGFNYKKTRYVNNNWQNYNLGIIINHEGEMSVGWKKKKDFKKLLHSFCMSKNDKGECTWCLKDVQYLQGIYSYYKQIEGETIDRLVHIYDKKFRCNIRKDLSTALKTAT